MANRKSDLPLHKKTLNLVAGDFEAMAVLFPSIGASLAIRNLVHGFVKRVRASTSPVEINLNMDDIKELMSDDRHSDN